MATVAGMMWQWGRKTDLREAAGQAIRYYERTRGRRPQVCYANRAAFASACDDDSALIVEGVPVRPLRGVAPFHLWVVEEEVDPGETRDDPKGTQHECQAMP